MAASSQKSRREMQHLLIVIIGVLGAVLLQDRPATAITAGCPRRYLRRINGKCYYFSVKKANWYGALNNCLRKGLTLADLNNPRDFYGVVEFLSSKGNTEDFWFGGNDQQTEGRFQYISNGRLVRYFSNISLVDPAEHSDCDDCLEVRIRNNITVVADDNCLERQYFICSERYCDDVLIKKPRHHSHEHLHHFHHDVGEPSEEMEPDLNTPSPFDDVREDEEQSQVEESVLPQSINDETPVEDKPADNSANAESITPDEESNKASGEMNDADEKDDTGKTEASNDGAVAEDQTEAGESNAEEVTTTAEMTTEDTKANEETTTAEATPAEGEATTEEVTTSADDATTIEQTLNTEETINEEETTTEGETERVESLTMPTEG